MTTKSISNAVAESIERSSSMVRDSVIRELAERELRSRSQAITDGYAHVNKLYKELQKVDRPDIVHYGRDGKPEGEGTYSKERAASIKKLEEDIEKWERALSAAWGETVLAGDTIPSKPDFTKLRELLGKTNSKSEG